MQRLSIIGTSGSGKATTARRLAESRQLPHLELDALVEPAGRPSDRTAAP